MKRLIVTADDLALHPAMTAGAIRAHREGIVTACSVSACGRDLDSTAAQLRTVPSLDVGIHFTLVEERPVLAAAAIPSLVGQDGRFLQKWPRFLARYLRGGIDRAELEAELRAQLAALRAAGLEIIHANSHQHLHLLPSLGRIVTKIAKEEGVAYVRTVRDRGLRWWTPRGLAIAMLGTLGRREQIRLTNDQTIGVTDAGHLDTRALVSLLGLVRNTTELVTHPGIGDEEISRTYDWGYAWDSETRALTAPEVRAALSHHEIQLTRIRDLTS